MLHVRTDLKDFIIISQARAALLNLQSAKPLFHNFWKKNLF